MKMHEQKNLFDKPFELETGTRHVEYDVATVTVIGQRFDLHDLHKALEEVEIGDTLISNSAMCRVLKELDVLSCCGSHRNCMPASKGRRFGEFFGLVESMYCMEGMQDE